MYDKLTINFVSESRSEKPGSADVKFKGHFNVFVL